VVGRDQRAALPLNVLVGLTLQRVGDLGRLNSRANVLPTAPCRRRSKLWMTPIVTSHFVSGSVGCRYIYGVQLPGTSLIGRRPWVGRCSLLRSNGQQPAPGRKGAITPQQLIVVRTSDRGSGCSPLQAVVSATGRFCGP
jgi:hypothetical protein